MEPLTTAQQDILDNLGDSEADESFPDNWDKEFQRSILSMLLAEKHFLLQSRDKILPRYFVDKAQRLICELLFDFYDEYNNAPAKKYLSHEITLRVDDEAKRVYFLAELNVLTDYFYPGLETRDYLQDNIVNFAQTQKIKVAFKDSMKVMKDYGVRSSETWDKVGVLLRDALLLEQNFDMGLDYFLDPSARYDEMEVESELGERFITRFPSVDDELTGGIGRGEIAAVVSASGVGKCFGLNTLVLMYDGTIKMVQNIKVGDLLMGDDSTPRKVLKTHTGTDDLYDIVPVKGDKYTVNSRHTLVLKTGSKRSSELSNSYHVGNSVFQIEVNEYLKQNKWFKTFTKGYRAESNWANKKVKVDPYFLGIWLGDGTSRYPEVTTADPEVVESLEAEAASRNLVLNLKEQREGCAIYSITSGGHNGPYANSLINDLRHYNLIQNKHVPNIYKANDRNTRLQILAGLLDSDGSKSNNCFDFINKNKTLAEDVTFIARSLGLAAYMKSSKKKSQNGVWGNYWRVTISGDTNDIPVRIVRKKCHKRKQVKNVLVTGITINYVGKGEYYGFETDGNHRFLLGDFTVVHNSVFLANVATWNVLRGKKVLYLSTEMKQNKVAMRIDSIMTGISIKDLVHEREQVIARLKRTVKDKDNKHLFMLKRFASKSADINTFRSYYSQVQMHGFIPDLVIVDYVGEMKDYADLPKHESRERMVGDLTRWCGEEDFALFTALQPNRTGKEVSRSGYIDDDHFGDSYGQIRPLDACWSLNQNDNENALGLMRGYVIKHRDGTAHYPFYVHCDGKYGNCTLRMSEISKDSYMKALNEKKEYTSAHTEIPPMIGTTGPQEIDLDDLK